MLLINLANYNWGYNIEPPKAQLSLPDVSVWSGKGTLFVSCAPEHKWATGFLCSIFSRPCFISFFFYLSTSLRITFINNIHHTKTTSLISDIQLLKVEVAEVLFSVFFSYPHLCLHISVSNTIQRWKWRQRRWSCPWAALYCTSQHMHSCQGLHNSLKQPKNMNMLMCVCWLMRVISGSAV